jgi:hypothetical protein
MDTKRTIQRINETNSWFFEKVNKIDTLLARLSKKTEKIQINDNKYEQGGVTTNANKIHGIIWECFENLLSINWKM